MGLLIGIPIILFYLYLCHKVGLKASDKGKNYIVWFLISMIIDPILAFVLVLMLG